MATKERRKDRKKEKETYLGKGGGSGERAKLCSVVAQRLVVRKGEEDGGGRW